MFCSTRKQTLSSPCFPFSTRQINSTSFKRLRLPRDTLGEKETTIGPRVCKRIRRRLTSSGSSLPGFQYLLVRFFAASFSFTQIPRSFSEHRVFEGRTIISIVVMEFELGMCNVHGNIQRNFVLIKL